MNPDRPFAWLSLEPRRDAPPRHVPQTPKTVKPRSDPAAVTLKRLRKENKDLRRRVRVLERYRDVLIRRAAEKDGVEVSRTLVSSTIRLIGECLVDDNSFTTLSSLAVTSRQNHSTLLPILYRCLIWDSVPAWRRMYPHVRKKFKIKRKSAHWTYTRYLVIDSEIWNIIRQKADYLFPNLAVVIVKHANYAKLYNAKDRTHLTASEARSIPDDEEALMPLEFLCDIDLRETVSARTLSGILRIPLRWEYGSRALIRVIRTVEHVSIKPKGIIQPTSDGEDEQWTPSVPHEDLEVSFESANPSAELLNTMRYIFHFLQPSTETVWSGGKGGADCTLRLSLPGELPIYHLFTALLEDILTRSLVINILINLGTPDPPITAEAFKQTMLRTAEIYSRVWPSILHAQAAHQPRSQFNCWHILSIQYLETTHDAQGFRPEYASSGCISTVPGESAFRLEVSHGRRFRQGFTREYGPFGAEHCSG